MACTKPSGTGALTQPVRPGLPPSRSCGAALLATADAPAPQRAAALAAAVRGASEAAAATAAAAGWTAAALGRLPPGLWLPLAEAFQRCRAAPPPGTAHPSLALPAPSRHARPVPEPSSFGTHGLALVPSCVALLAVAPQTGLWRLTPPSAGRTSRLRWRRSAPPAHQPLPEAAAAAAAAAAALAGRPGLRRPRVRARGVVCPGVRPRRPCLLRQSRGWHCRRVWRRHKCLVKAGATRARARARARGGCGGRPSRLGSRCPVTSWTWAHQSSRRPGMPGREWTGGGGGAGAGQAGRR
jgi:hypothetical protein